ncbi:MAG: glycosyltransferase family 39 protein [Lachnospiraceae bacterium]
MIAVLPLVFTLLFINSYRKKGQFIKSIVDSTVLFTGIAYLMTEVLSAIGMLTDMLVKAGWLLIALMMVMHLYRNRVSTQSAWTTAQQKISCSSLMMKCIVMAFGTWYVYLMYLAYVTIPNNWDSMTYHLPRVMHWMQNESVGYYATNIDRQVVSPVLSEYLLLHTYLLSGTQQYVNLIQNLSFIISAVVIYGIAKKLGARSRSAFIAPFVFLTVPMAIAQSFSTQTDLLAALYLILFSYYLIDFLKCKKLIWDKDKVAECGKMAACVAFAYLTKQTVCIVILLFLIALVVVRVWKRDKPVILIQFTLLSAIVMISLALPGFIRNYQTYGSVLLQEGTHTVTLDSYEPKLVLVNTYKNVVCNYVIEYIPQMEQMLENTGYTLAEELEVDLDDAAITSTNFYVYSGSYHHDLVVSFGINYMMLFVLGLLFVYKKQYKKKGLLVLFAGVSVFSFIFLCMMIRWSPWMIRYMIGIYGIYAAVIAATIDPLLKKNIGKIFLLAVIALSLFEGAQAYEYNIAVADYSATTDDPNDLYFFVRPESTAYTQICDYILEGDVDELGIILGIDTYEYPLWTGLAQDLPTIKHINVTSQPLSAYEDPDYVPDMIVDIYTNNYQLYDQITYNGHTYVCELVNEVGYVLTLITE